ncbi:MAG: helix-turn-helix domain-containing protein [Smithellaceae bacterium]|nr:helix-turn-helix domain-containing protein [Smithellaceae bacterium]
MTTENNADLNATDLKKARENSGLTLNELFERTRISVRYLEAIENDDFHVLPVPAYSKNFIRTYADAIGVDSGPVLQRYENHLKNLQSPSPEQETEPSCLVPPSAGSKKNKMILWIMLIIIVFASAAFFISNRNTTLQESAQKTALQHQKESVPPPVTKLEHPHALPVEINLQKQENPVMSKPNDNQPQAEEVISVESWSDRAQDRIKTEGKEEPVPPSEEENASKEALHQDVELSTLVVQATEETWIRIQADDKEAFQMLLKAGEKVSHKAERFNVDLGNAGGVQISFNGKNIKNLGKSGQVIHLRLP